MLLLLLFFLINSFHFSINVSLQCNFYRSFNESDCLCDQVNEKIPAKKATCTYLNLEKFPDITSILKEQINSLDLSHNNIKNLGAINLENASLTGLSLSYNNLEDIEDLFHFLILRYLDLSHNNLTSLSLNCFKSLNKLEQLDLSYNNIAQIADGIFSPLNNLKVLNLSNNPLDNFFANAMALTEKLTINSNVTHLSLDNVGLKNVHTKCWDSFQNLKYITLADNPLDEIPNAKPSLEYLDVSATNITSLKGELKYPNLKILKLSRMPNLEYIEENAFISLTNLEEIEISNCPQLKEINELIFGPLKKSTKLKLKKLDLSRNRLKTLNETFLYLFDRLEKADVTFNTWKCDCQLLWMQEVMDTKILGIKQDLRCASPSGMENKLILDLVPSEIPTCYPQIYGKKSHHIALILLIFVVVVLLAMIIYLCLWSPVWSVKLTKHNMSPESPYSIQNDNEHI